MEKPLVKRGPVPKSQQNTTKRTPPCAYFLRCTLLLYCKCYLWNMPFTDGVCYNTVQYNMIWYTTPQCITLTSQWALWPLKSPVYRVFVNRMFKAHIKGNIKALRHWPLWGNPPVTYNHKGHVTRTIFPFDDVIMDWGRTWMSMNSPDTPHTFPSRVGYGVFNVSAMIVAFCFWLRLCLISSASVVQYIPVIMLTGGVLLCFVVVIADVFKRR